VHIIDINEKRWCPVSQHFLLTAAARSLSLAQVARLSDEEAHAKFCEIRWSDNGGSPIARAAAV